MPFFVEQCGIGNEAWEGYFVGDAESGSFGLAGLSFGAVSREGEVPGTGGF